MIEPSVSMVDTPPISKKRDGKASKQYGRLAIVFESIALETTESNQSYTTLKFQTINVENTLSNQKVESIIIAKGNSVGSPAISVTLAKSTLKA